jgi:hypothetical protein
MSARAAHTAQRRSDIISIMEFSRQRAPSSRARIMIVIIHWPREASVALRTRLAAPAFYNAGNGQPYSLSSRNT